MVSRQTSSILMNIHLANLEAGLSYCYPNKFVMLK